MVEAANPKKTLSSTLEKAFLAGAVIVTFGAVTIVDTASARANVSSLDDDTYAVNVAKAFLSQYAANGSWEVPTTLNLSDDAMKAFLASSKEKDMMQLRVANSKAY